MSDSSLITATRAPLAHEIDAGRIRVTPAAVIMWNGYPHVAVREPTRVGRFHLSRCYKSGDLYAIDDYATSAVLHQPLDQSMVPTDIQGATYAEWTGTAWRMAHCSPPEQVDFANEAAAFVRSQFQQAVNETEPKIHEATNPTLKRERIAKQRALVKFVGAAAKEARDEVLEAPLGHYHANPHDDHKRDLAVSGIRLVLADWKKKGLGDEDVAAERAAVATEAAEVVTALTETHTIEWRHERAARLEAERKRREAEAAQPDQSAGSGAQGD